MADTTAPTQTGLTANVAGALAYVLGPITGVLFLVLERENRFVRFHAMQSIIVSVAFIALSIVLGILTAVLAFVPIVGWLLGLLMSVGMGFGGLVLWVLLIVNALRGQEWEVPFVGRYARQHA
jgi:uncharacterized membrane protein